MMGEKTAQTPFKVAIVGGSIAGLATALHLEKLGIDWILVERGAEIAPQLGANIAVAPNGLAVLKQLGCFEEVARRSSPMMEFTARDNQGTTLTKFKISERMRAKYGFDIYVTERVVVVEAIYNQIQHKERILTGRKITRIEQNDEGVELFSSDGQTWKADMVVGADGVHSITREQMWKMGNKEDPSTFGASPGNQVETEFSCVFGISSATGDIKSGEVIHIHSRGLLIGILTGPDDVVYWYLIFSHPSIKGQDLPRYTSEDEAEVVKRAANVPITPKTTFMDIYKNKTRTNTTHLSHYYFEKWHYNRLVCIGDSVHKFNPITGQGGCSAIESAAMLVDNLHEVLTRRREKPPSTRDLEDAFERTSQARRARVTAGVAESMQATRFGAWTSWGWELLDKYVMWLIPEATMVDIMSQGAVGGYRSKTLP